MSCLLALILLRTPLKISGVNFVVLTIIKMMSMNLLIHGQNFVPGLEREIILPRCNCGLASQSDFLSSLAIWVQLHSIFQAPAPKDSNLVACTSMGDMKWGFQHPWYQYSFHVPGPLGSFCDSSGTAVCDRCPLTSFHTCLYMHNCDLG